MKLEYDEPRVGYDHQLARVDGKFIGFRGIGETRVCLQRCPVCKRENYCTSVISGVCCWCGFDANELSEREENGIV